MKWIPLVVLSVFSVMVWGGILWEAIEAEAAQVGWVRGAARVLLSIGSVVAAFWLLMQCRDLVCVGMVIALGVGLAKWWDDAGKRAASVSANVASPAEVRFARIVAVVLLLVFGTLVTLLLLKPAPAP